MAACIFETKATAIVTATDMVKATQNGATPVFISSCNGQLDVVRFLSKNGADVNVAMEDGATPVYVSAATVGVPCVPLFFGGADRQRQV